MKRSKILIITIIAMLSLVSCREDNLGNLSDKYTIIKGRMEQPNTDDSTRLGYTHNANGSSSLFWEVDDEAGLYCPNGSYNGRKGVSNIVMPVRSINTTTGIAEFLLAGDVSVVGKMYAYYPYSDVNSSSETSVNGEIETDQLITSATNVYENVIKNAFMYSSEDIPSSTTDISNVLLNFKQTFCLLNFEIYSTSPERCGRLKRIKVKAKDIVLSGGFDIDLTATTPIPNFTKPVDSVALHIKYYNTLPSTKTSAANYYLLVNTAELSGKKIQITYTIDNYDYTVTKRILVNFKRGNTYRISIDANDLPEGTITDCVDEGSELNPRYTIVGCGYNYFDYYADPSRLKLPILSYSAMKKDGIIDSSSLSTSTYDYNSGSTVSETMNYRSRYIDISQDMTFDGDFLNILGFKMSIKGSYSTEYLEKEGYNYAIGEQRVRKALCRVKQSHANATDLKQYLISTAKQAIDGTKAEYKTNDGIDKLFNEYGTHVIVWAYKGGRVDYSMTAYMDSVKYKEDIGEFLNASVNITSFLDVTSNTNVTIKDSVSNYYINNQHLFHSKVNVIGGAAEYAHNITKDNYNEWAAGFSKPENCELSEFAHEQGDISLIPIWYFCDNETRRKELYDYFIGDWAEKFKLPEVKNTTAMVVDVDNCNFKDSWVNKVECNGTVVAEICKEYIPQLGGKIFTCIYPVKDNKPDLTRGYIVDDGGEIRWRTKDVSRQDELYFKLEGDCIGRPAGIGWQGKVVIYRDGRITEYSTDIKETKSTTISPQYITDVRKGGNGKVYTTNHALVKVATVFVCRSEFEQGIYTDGVTIPGRVTEKFPIGYTGFVNSNTGEKVPACVDRVYYRASAFLGVYQHQLAPATSHIATEQDWLIIRNHLQKGTSERRFCRLALVAGINDFVISLIELGDSDWVMSSRKINNTINDKYVIGSSVNSNSDSCFIMGEDLSMEIVPLNTPLFYPKYSTVPADRYFIRIVRDY